jgi:hypothetical protein
MTKTLRSFLFILDRMQLAKKPPSHATVPVSVCTEHNLLPVSTLKTTRVSSREFIDKFNRITALVEIIGYIPNIECFSRAKLLSMT